LPGAAEALQDDLPLPAGAAFALHDDLPPAADDGSVAPEDAPFPPPQPTAEPISIPATAETARVFARFMSSSSPRLFVVRRVFFVVCLGDSAPGSVIRTRQD
jgi:hypothetical protein